MSNKDEREIDLIVLLIRFILFLKRRFLILFIITIIGTSVGFFKVFFEKRKYENKIIGSSDIVPNNVIFQIFNSLRLDFQNNKKNFSNELNLPEEIVGKIIKLDFDTIAFGNRNSIEIKIHSKDSNSFELIKTAIINYLTRNSFINDEFKFAFKQKEQLIAEVNQKLKELDSLQRNIRKATYKDNTDIAIIDSYYTEYIELYEKKQKIEKEVQFLDKILYIYIDTITPLANKTILKILLSFIISAIIAFSVALMIELKLKINEYRKQNKI